MKEKDTQLSVQTLFFAWSAFYQLVNDLVFAGGQKHYPRALDSKFPVGWKQPLFTHSGRNPRCLDANPGRLFLAAGMLSPAHGLIPTCLLPSTQKTPKC